MRATGDRLARRGVRVIAEIGRWAAGAWLLARLTPLSSRSGETGDTERTRQVPAVVIPARNEARALPRLLDSLLRQTLKPAELVVADDASDDGTAEVARERHARVISPGGVLPGWTGKTWACRAGIEATTTSLVVLLDADTELAPDGLQKLTDGYAVAGDRGLLSVVPDHVATHYHQRLSAICQLVAAMGTGAFSAVPRWTAAPAAFGPCMVFRREDYGAVGGHASVRGEQAEDIALARRFAEAQRPVRLLAGKPAVRVHMYPDGIRQLIDGWARTLAAGAGATRPLTLVLVVAWVSGLIAASGSLAAATVALMKRRRRRALIGLFRYGAYSFEVEWLLGRVGTFGAGTGLAFPLPLAAFLASFTRSWAARAGWGRLAWKGRPV